MSAGMRMLGMRPAASGIFAIGSVAFAALGLVSCSADVSRFDYPMFAGEQASDNSLTTASVNPVPSEPVYQGGMSYGSSYGGASYTAASEQTVMKSELPPPGAPAGAQPYRPQSYQPEPYQSRPYQSQPVQSYPQRVASAEPARATPPRPQPAPATRAPLPEPEQTVHTVRRGDTLAAIARKYDVGVAEIMKANKLSGTRLDIDQKLVIPAGGGAGATVAAKGSSETVYHVRSGDTLSSIARKHGLDYHDLARHNGLRTTSVLSLGQAIHIPAGAKAVTPEPVKVASRGDAIPLPSGNPSRADDAGAAPEPAETRVAARPRPEAEKESLPDPAPMTGNNFRWPVRGRVISAFGSKPNGKHNDGINVAVPLGTSVKAAENGVVAYAGSELEGYGNLILIRHANGWVSAYAHNDEILVKRGDEVRRGQVISKAGKTGSVSQPQVHFELRKGSQPVDPLKHLANG